MFPKIAKSLIVLRELADIMAANLWLWCNNALLRKIRSLCRHLFGAGAETFRCWSRSQKTLDAWSWNSNRSLELEFRFHSPIATTFNCFCKIFEIPSQFDSLIFYKNLW